MDWKKIDFARVIAQYIRREQKSRFFASFEMSLATKYFDQAATEGVIICEATPIKLGKRSQIWEAKLYNNEVECARSTVRLTNIDRS